MATHSNILAWEIPWTEEPGGLQSIQLQKSWQDLATKTTITCQVKLSKGHLRVSSCLIQKPGNHTGPSHYSTVCIQSTLCILSPKRNYMCPLHCYHPTPRHYYFWPGWRQPPPRIPPAQSCPFIIHPFHSSQGFLTITSLLSLELASGFKILLG